jgi:hypothetical protein
LPTKTKCPIGRNNNPSMPSMVDPVASICEPTCLFRPSIRDAVLAQSPTML